MYDFLFPLGLSTQRNWRVLTAETILDQIGPVGNQKHSLTQAMTHRKLPNHSLLLNLIKHGQDHISSTVKHGQDHIIVTKL